MAKDNAAPPRRTGAEAIKDFVRLMDGLDRSKRRTEVFRDFCEMAYCALAKPCAPTRKQAERLEADYMACVKRYRNKDDVRAMPELLAIASGALSGGGCDFFGGVAAEIGALDSHLGQFFTPYEISRFNAELILTDASSFIDARGYITLSEPAAGAGGMVIAAADTLARQGFDPATQMWFEAVELNRATYHMLYVQTALRGIAGRVICGNSLSLEIFEESMTPAAGRFLGRHGVP